MTRIPPIGLLFFLILFPATLQAQAIADSVKVDSIHVDAFPMDSISVDSVSVDSILPQALVIDTITVIGTGDIMPGTNYPDNRYLPPGNNCAALFDPVRKAFFH